MHEMGLGSASGRTAVTLSHARAAARELHVAVREGRDPLAERKAEKAKVEADAAKTKAAGMTFREVADMYYAAHQAGWRSPKHCLMWRSSLRDYVLPAIGNLPVGSVDTGAVLRVIEPLWSSRTTTASRLRGRIEAVLDYAKPRGWFQGENPARWRGHLDNLLPAKSKVHRVEHHAALPWREIGAFMQRLRCCFSVSSLCLQFLILTAARSSEAGGARWAEIDLDHAVWTVPPARMKAGREHRVPLSDSAFSVLRKMAEFGTEGFVFPGLKAATTPSDVTLARLIEATGGDGATIHGFRSTFRDWAGEDTHFPRELGDLALLTRLGLIQPACRTRCKTAARPRAGDRFDTRFRVGRRPHEL
jgi:integrase